jgi:hypothetical protein
VRWKKEGKKNPPSLKAERKRSASVVVILLLFTVLVFAGSFLYFKVLVDRPEKVIADALASGLEDGFSDSPIEFTGEITAGDKTEQVQTTFSGISEKGLLSGRGNQHYFATIDYKKADKTTVIEAEFFTTQDGSVYVKVQNLQEVVNKIASDAKLTYGKEGEAVLQNLIAKYNKKWIKLSPSEAKILGLEFLSRTNECEVARQGVRFDQEDIETLKNAYTKNPFVALEEDLGSEKINGRRSHHYKLSINEAQVNSFIEGSSQLSLMQALRTCQQTIMLGLSAAELKSSAVELWVDLANHKITQLRVQNTKNEVTSTYQLSPSQKTPKSNIAQPNDALLYADFQKEIELILGVPLQQITAPN